MTVGHIGNQNVRRISCVMDSHEVKYPGVAVALAIAHARARPPRFERAKATWANLSRGHLNLDLSYPEHQDVSFLPIERRDVYLESLGRVVTLHVRH